MDFLIFLISMIFPSILLAWDTNAKLQPDFKIIRSGYFRQYENLVPYETTAKVIYKIGLPVHSITQAGVCPLTHLSCRMKQTLIAISDQNLKMLRTIAEANRKERQLVILAAGFAGGILINSVMSRMSNSLFGSEADAERAIEQIRSSMVHNNKEVLLFEHEVRSFALNITDGMVNLRTNQHEILTVLNLLEVDALIRNNWVHLELGLQSCFNRHVPFTLVTPTLLRRSLATVSARGHRHGLVLSVPSRNVEKYYKMKISDCFLTGSALYVMVNIPLSRRNWKIAQLIPVPFSSHGFTCHFGTKNPITIAADGDVIALDSYASQFCDIHEYQLCMVPSLSTPSSLEICLKSMFYGNDGSNSSQHCQFHCNRNSHLTTYEVTSSVVVATNGHSLKTSCGSFQKEYQLDGANAVEIKLRCNCSYVLDGKAFDAGFACANGSHEFHDVVTVIPEVWSKLSVRQLYMQPTELANVWNDNWTLSAPDVRDFIVPEPFNNFRLDLNGSALIVVGIFVTLLSFGVLALLRCYCKLLKV